MKTYNFYSDENNNNNTDYLASIIDNPDAPNYREDSNPDMDNTLDYVPGLDQILNPDYFIIVLLSSIALVLGLQKAGNYFRSVYERIPLLQGSTLEARINSNLYQILETTQADRVLLALVSADEGFSLRSRFTKKPHLCKTGEIPLDQWKVSIEYEAVRSGVSSATHTFQRVPVSSLMSLFNQINNHTKVIYRTNMLTEVEDKKLKQYAAKNGIKSTITILLGDYDDCEVGCLGVLAIHYLTERPDILAKFDGSVILKQLNAIELYLE